MSKNKGMARALRRHHAKRVKKARQFYWGRNENNPLSARHQGILLHTTHLCSGVCCGNPRKWLGERSVQERRWLQETVDDALNA